MLHINCEKSTMPIGMNNVSTEAPNSDVSTSSDIDKNGISHCGAGPAPMNTVDIVLAATNAIGNVGNTLPYNGR